MSPRALVAGTTDHFPSLFSAVHGVCRPSPLAKQVYKVCAGWNDAGVAQLLSYYRGSLCTKISS